MNDPFLLVMVAFGTIATAIILVAVIFRAAHPRAFGSRPRPSDPSMYCKCRDGYYNPHAPAWTPAQGGRLGDCQDAKTRRRHIRDEQLRHLGEALNEAERAGEVDRMLEEFSQKMRAK